MIPRSAWGALPPKKPIAYTDKDLFICHHSATKGNWSTLESESATMRSWQKYHMDRWDAADIMYNAVIFPSGRTYEGRYGGWKANGGGAFSCNQRGFGVCLAGDFTNEFPSLEALEALVKLAIEARDVLGIHPDRYWGHRDCALYDTRNRGNSCPGEMFYNWLPVLRRTVGVDGAKEENEVSIYPLIEMPKQGDLFVYVAPDAFTKSDLFPRVVCYLNAYNETGPDTEVEVITSPNGKSTKVLLKKWGRLSFDMNALSPDAYGFATILKSKVRIAPTMTVLAR